MIFRRSAARRPALRSRSGAGLDRAERACSDLGTGIDLVVLSLTEEWARYSDESLGLLASLDYLVVLGEARPPYDPALADRAFREAPPSDQGARASVVAVRRLQEALSARFDRTITWADEAGLEEYLGQLDPHAALALHQIASGAEDARFPNLVVMDIANVYLPVELPAVLVGQPRSIGSVPALRRKSNRRASS